MREEAADEIIAALLDGEVENPHVEVSAGAGREEESDQ